MKLSIITINYNNKTGLQKTIDSVICQTWKDYEWIIIDGGSTDGSKELIEKYQQHFAYWCSEPDMGVYNAMNKGIAKAKGEYLNFMNSGDVFYNEKILQNIFDQPLDLDIIYGDWIRIKYQQTEYIHAPKEVTLDFLYGGNICHQAMFIKSEMLKKEGYDESFKIYADWARWIKMFYDGATAHHLSFPVCIFDATDGISNRLSPELSVELERARQQLPLHIRGILERSYQYKKRLSALESSFLVQDTYSLINERPLYCKLIHLNIIVVKGIRKILKALNL